MRIGRVEVKQHTLLHCLYSDWKVHCVKWQFFSKWNAKFLKFLHYSEVQAIPFSAAWKTQTQHFSLRSPDEQLQKCNTFALPILSSVLGFDG